MVCARIFIYRHIFAFVFLTPPTQTLLLYSLSTINNRNRTRHRGNVRLPRVLPPSPDRPSVNTPSLRGIDGTVRQRRDYNIRGHAGSVRVERGTARIVGESVLRGGHADGTTCRSQSLQLPIHDGRTVGESTDEQRLLRKSLG